MTFMADGMNVITATAFYFGVTSDPLISRYFPPATGAKYLFRDFRPTTTSNDPSIPSELILLVPATDSETLISTNLGSIANLIREHGGSELRFSLFYNESLDTVLTTRDFILIAAADTITLTGQLPHGQSYSSVINNQPGRYIFNLDHDIDVEQDLSAFTALGSDPSLYSDQTRNAINTNPHITALFSGIPNSDTLRTQLLEGIIDPTSSTNNPE